MHIQNLVICKYIDAWIFLLYVCIPNVLPEQLLRMPGTNVLSIINTTGVKDMLEDLLGLIACVPFLWYYLLYG